MAARPPLRIAVLLAVLAALLAAAVLLLWSERSPFPRARTAAELLALPDDDLDVQVAVDLSRRVQADPTAWRRFKPPARAVWATNVVSRLILLQGFRALAPGGGDLPGLADAQEGYAAMGLAELERILAETPGADQREARFGAALARAGNHARRLAYLREHAGELADP